MLKIIETIFPTFVWNLNLLSVVQDRNHEVHVLMLHSVFFSNIVLIPLTDYVKHFWCFRWGDRLRIATKLTTVSFYNGCVSSAPSQVLVDVPLQKIVRMWLMHDGASPCFVTSVRTFLNDKCWERYGPTEWPATWPDLSLLKSYLWNCL